MNIRDARAEDLEGMMELAKCTPSAAHWPESSYSEILADGDTNRVSLVAEHGGVLQGFLLARFVGDECELENIVVAEKGRGVGLNLIRELMNTSRDCHVNRIFLEVRESNVTARSFYEACGFLCDGRRKGYYGDPPEDAVLYTLAL